MNDSERSNWIDNDEGLYNMFRSSRKAKAKFVKDNRSMIDSVIANVVGGKQPAHYLVYGGKR